MDTPVTKADRMLRKMDSSGDCETPFSFDNPETLEEANRVFAEVLAKGGRAFALHNGGDSTPIKTLLEMKGAPEVLLIPLVVGG